jgi:SNF2 family DNA or RNA helicase
LTAALHLKKVFFRFFSLAGKGMISAERLSRYDIVLTTYQTMAMEAPAAARPAHKQAQQQQLQGSLGGSSLVSPPSLGAQNVAADVITLLSDDEEDVPGPSAKKQRLVENVIKPPVAKGGPLFRIRWHRVVLDEAQCIKNPRTLAAHAAWSLKAGRRWCLSGTPMQNAVDVSPWSFFLDVFNAFQQMIPLL